MTSLTQYGDLWEVGLNHEDTIITDNVCYCIRSLGTRGRLYGWDSIFRFFPVPLLMNITERVKPTIHHLIQHIGRRISMKQVEDGNILIGGGWPTQFQQTNGKVDFDRSPKILNHFVKENVKIAAHLVPEVQKLSIVALVARGDGCHG